MIARVQPRRLGDGETGIRHAAEPVAPVVHAALSSVLIRAVLVRDLADLYRGEFMPDPVVLCISLSHQVDIEVGALLAEPSALVLP